MKTDPFVEERVRAMTTQDVPEDKRTEYAKYLRGFWSRIGGYTHVVDTAIDHLQTNDIRGTEAVDYIDKQIQRRNNHLEEGLVENFIDSWTQPIIF